MFLPLLLMLGVSAPSFQAASASTDLASLIRNLPAEAAQAKDPSPVEPLADRLAEAPLQEVEANLPALIALTESSNDRTRSFAELSLLGVEGMAGKSPHFDSERIKLLSPYAARLIPHLFDPSTLGATVILLSNLASVRPLPPDLLRLLTNALADPRSTQPLPLPPSQLPRPKMIVGPAIVDILLRAGATFHLDSTTHITEGSDSAEVQQAILRFLRRPDQTDSSIGQTIHVMALAQPQNPKLNADLLRFLDSKDPTVQMEMLRNLTRLTFTPADFANAKAHLSNMVSDPATSSEFRTVANTILPCWDNNRHHLCQDISNAVNVK
jgi:hypothetical protein